MNYSNECCQIMKIDCDPTDSDGHRASESISDTNHLLNWNGDVDDANVTVQTHSILSELRLHEHLH